MAAICIILLAWHHHSLIIIITIMSMIIKENQASPPTHPTPPGQTASRRPYGDPGRVSALAHSNSSTTRKKWRRICRSNSHSMEPDYNPTEWKITGFVGWFQLARKNDGFDSKCFTKQPLHMVGNLVASSPSNEFGKECPSWWQSSHEWPVPHMCICHPAYLNHHL